MKNKRTSSIKTIKRLCGAAALCAASLFALAPAAHASPYTYIVTLDVSSLTTAPNGLYSLDLQLVPGSDNVTNTVTLSNFHITGGSFTGSPTFTFGGESGSTSGSVVLTNSNPSDNEFAQAFTASTTKITFQVSETNNAEVVGSGLAIPDQFNVAILDTNLSNITTSDPSGGNELISHAMEGTQGPGQVGMYSSNGLDGNGGVTAVPEPGSTTMLCLGGVMLALVFIRRKATKVCA